MWPACLVSHRALVQGPSTWSMWLRGAPLVRGSPHCPHPVLFSAWVGVLMRFTPRHHVYAAGLVLPPLGPAPQPGSGSRPCSGPALLTAPCSLPPGATGGLSKAENQALTLPCPNPHVAPVALRVNPNSGAHRCPFWPHGEARRPQEDPGLARKGGGSLPPGVGASKGQGHGNGVAPFFWVRKLSLGGKVQVGEPESCVLGCTRPCQPDPQAPGLAAGPTCCWERKDPAAASCWWGAGEGGVVRVSSLRRVPRDPCPARSGIKAAASSMRCFSASCCNRIGTFEVNRKRGGSHVENTGQRAPGASLSWAG